VIKIYNPKGEDYRNINISKTKTRVISDLQEEHDQNVAELKKDMNTGSNGKRSPLHHAQTGPAVSEAVMWTPSAIVSTK
jgi:hypothetical protein